MNPDFRIRPATPEDAERLAHIGVATFVESYTLVIEGDAMMTHCTRQHSPHLYASYLFDPSKSVWLAEHATTGAPVGYAVNTDPDLPVPVQPGERELKRIYVLSRFHGTGTGKALMDTAVEEARARGAPRLLLGTYQDNHRAVAFYNKAGFETCGTRQFQVGNLLFDDIVMAKKL